MVRQELTTRNPDALYSPMFLPGSARRQSFSVSAEQGPGCKPAVPVMISDDVIVPTGGREFPSFEDLADAAATRDSLSCGTERVILHAVAFKKDVVADEEHILKNVEGEAGCVTVDVEGLDALMKEVFFKSDIEGEGATDLVDRVVVVDLYLGSEEFSVQVGSAEEVVMRE